MADPFASLDLDALVKQATAAPPSTAYVGDTIKRVRDLESQKQAETAPIVDRMKSDFAADRKEVEAKTPQPADVTAWTQKLPEAHPVEAFGSFGSVFGILASAFTHQPWQTAMTAASSAMNAVRANDIATYKDAYQAWKGNTDLMLKRHDEQYKDFQAAMDKMKTDTAEGNAMLTAMSAKYGDQITEAYKEAGLNGELVKVWEARQRAAQGLLETMPRIEDLNTQVTLVHDLKTAREELAQTQKVGDPSQIEEAQREVQAKEQAVRDYGAVKYPSLAGANMNTSAGQKAAAVQQLRQEFIDANGREPNGTEMTEIVQKVGRSSPQNALLDEKTLDSMADQYLAGDKSVVQGLGYGNVGAENRAKLRGAIQKMAEDRGMSGRDIATAIAEFSGLVAGERAVGTRVANVSLAVNEAKRLVPPALEASRAFPRTEFVPLNRAVQEIEKGTGDTKIVRFAAASNSLINAYVRAISPTGVPTDILRQHAYAILETAFSQEQYEAAVDQLQIEMNAAMLAPHDVKQDMADIAAGRVRGADGKAVSPETKTIDGKSYVKRNGQWFPE